MGMRRKSPGEVLIGRCESEDKKLRPDMRTLNHNHLMVMDKIAMKMAKKMTIMMMMLMLMLMMGTMREETEKETETNEIIITREIKEKGREKMKKC